MTVGLCFDTQTTVNGLIDVIDLYTLDRPRWPIGVALTR